MAMEWEEAKRKLLKEGFLEIPGFRIELTLDNTFLDLEYIPRIAVYWEGDGRWHVLRNPIPGGETLDEGWRNAVLILEKIIEGEMEPDLGDQMASDEFISTLRRTFGSDGKRYIVVSQHIMGDEDERKGDS
jgi:hypothetical protein